LDILRPIAVPWMVSPSVSSLQLHLAESENWHVSVNAVWHPDLLTRSALQSGRISLTFHRATQLRVCGTHSDATPLPPGLFDESHLNLLFSSDYQRSFIENWMQQRSCPDPGFYSVESSSWNIDTVGSGRHLSHYVLVATDVFLEVLAVSHKWDAAALAVDSQSHDGPE
jgi:hypothetical protein